MPSICDLVQVVSNKNVNCKLTTKAPQGVRPSMRSLAIHKTKLNNNKSVSYCLVGRQMTRWRLMGFRLLGDGFILGCKTVVIIGSICCIGSLSENVNPSITSYYLN